MGGLEWRRLLDTRGGEGAIARSGLADERLRPGHREMGLHRNGQLVAMQIGLQRGADIPDNCPLTSSVNAPSVDGGGELICNQRLWRPEVG